MIKSSSYSYSFYSSCLYSYRDLLQFSAIHVASIRHGWLTDRLYLFWRNMEQLSKSEVVGVGNRPWRVFVCVYRPSNMTTHCIMTLRCRKSRSLFTQDRKGLSAGCCCLKKRDYLGRRNRSSNQMGKNDWPGSSFTSVR